MVGFEDSVNMAEETVDPPKTFPRAMLLAMGITATIYLVVAVIASTLVPTEQLAEAESGALLKVVQTASPAFPAIVFAAITLFAVTNTALINMMMASRLLYGMANERIIPKAFGKVHPDRRTPWFAIVVTSGLAIILVLLLDISELGSMTSLLLLVGVHHRQHRGAGAASRARRTTSTSGPRRRPGGRRRAVRVPRQPLLRAPAEGVPVRRRS